MLLQCMTGFENFSNASAKVYVFVCPTPRFPGKEMHIGVAAKGAYPGLRRVGAESKTPAAPGLRRELGEWVSGGFEVPDGMVLKVFATRSGGWGQMRVSANQFIRARADAALRRISVVLTGQQSASFSRANIEGRFDLLSLEEGMQAGALVPPSFRASFDESMQRRAFEHSVLEAEMRSVAVQEVRHVTNSKGQEVEVQSTARRRALDL